jgi:tRNA threonylcarbamoyladenosine modification (KEOPS) complex  Pcc1 subunit
MSKHKVTEEIHEAVEIQDKKKTDSRGRINLGTDYADKVVKVAILEVE